MRSPVGGRREDPADPLPGVAPGGRGGAWIPAMTLERIAWSIVILACLVTAIVLVIGHRYGSGGVAAAVGLAAATNLR